MANKGFTHLHVHSQYSLLDGAVSLDKLLTRCTQLGMDSVAVTDHGNMFGVIEFYTKAAAANIKPILGIESYVAPGSRFDKSKCSISDAAYHLVLLAENLTGYKNLLKLASAGFTEGFYYRPRIDKEILSEFSEGLIATSGCLKGEIAMHLARGDEKAANQAVDSFMKIFPRNGHDRFFIELQIHEKEDMQLFSALVDIANKKGLPLVATNDVHFLTAEDYEAHNCLCCIGTGKKSDEPDRLIYPPDVYLKSPDEMRTQQLLSSQDSSLTRAWQQACDNTLDIAKRCNISLDLKSRHAPRYQPPDGTTPEHFLTRLCYQRAEKLYGKITDQLKARLDRELEVIESKGFASYFLIVWDFCNYAHQNNIPVGARGSAVGTVVGYCLGLCNVDPLRYDLLFERFMDPQRNEMPDVDIDICQDGRSKIIEYVRNKYGHVAQIITFGTMKARAAIRDICRVLAVPLSEADRLAKLVPESLDMTLDLALETEPQLKDAYETSDQTRKVIDIAKRLEGLTRHASVHAAGVVIADQPLTDFLPLYKASNSDDIITQLEGPMVEKAGLLKMDFLGLKTLSVLYRSIAWVKSIHNVDIDIERIDLTDQKVFALFGAGRTKGIFQFESGGMQDLLMKMKPDRVEDLIAANALYRPGPMTLIPDYIDRKHGAKWTLPHPVMSEILNETYGIMVYQEQVMRICNKLGDIPLREAYALIKAISKKKASIIEKERERFIAGSVAKGLKNAEAAEIFDLIERFAGYGFNKSHSTRYAVIAYQTAYMKTYWPVEYMASLLTYEKSDTDKVVEYINECKAMGIEVLPPELNESLVDFTPLYKKTEAGKPSKGVVRFGLAAVKGVGEKAVEQIIAARERVGRFQSLFHFCENVDLRAANKQVVESLIKAGAFDRLGGSRPQMMAALEKAMEMGSRLQSDKQSGQMNLLSGVPGDYDYSQDAQRLPRVDPWPEAQMLAYEKEVLGFYVTDNPLSACAETINLFSTVQTSSLLDCPQDKEIIIGGMIAKIRYHITKAGRNAGSKMAVFVLEDLAGSTEVVLFPETLAKFTAMLEDDKIVFVKGKADRRREKPNVIAEELIDIDSVWTRLAAKVRINLDAASATDEKVTEIKTICRRHAGKSPLYITIRTEKGKVFASATKNLSVNPNPEFCRKIRHLLGPENLQLTR